MATLLIVAAFATTLVLSRYAVLAAARRAVAWEDECRSRLRDRQWATVEARWSQEIRRT